MAAVVAKSDIVRKTSTMVARRRFTTYYTAVSTRLCIEIKFLFVLQTHRDNNNTIIAVVAVRLPRYTVARGGVQCGYRGVIITVRCCCVQNNNATEYARTGFSTGLGARALYAVLVRPTTRARAL